MRILFVTPVETASGEIITAIHMAESLIALGAEVRFLTSPFGRTFIEQALPNHSRSFTDKGSENRDLWDATLQDFRPEVVVFADYPLLFFSHGVSPLADIEAWARELDRAATTLVTLDHFGYAQRPNGMFIGPAHLSFDYIEWPAIPAEMEILLPCPMCEPGPVTGRKGQPFRYWDVPLSVPEAQRQAVRRRYLAHEDDFLIFHPVPRWAWETARAFSLPYYRLLPEILTYYLAGLPRPVTVLSLNDGHLLDQPGDSPVRFLNVPNLPKAEYEALLFGADLMLTENNASITLGKAICGYLPCAVLHNSYTYRQLLERMNGPLRKTVKAMEAIRPGAVFPYHSFASGTDELERLGLYRENSITRGFQELEVFGEDETREAFRRLLADAGAREARRAAQQTYVEKVASLPDTGAALEQILEKRKQAA